jgi:uncharacterized membrane protein YhaH (DUF805 family)
MSIKREIYWAAQGVLIGLALILSLSFSTKWQIWWGIAAVAQCFLLPARMIDAGWKWWVAPLVIIAVVAAVFLTIHLLANWAVREGQAGGGDGAGLLYAMISLSLAAVCATALVVLPGVFPSRQHA